MPNTFTTPNMSMVLPVVQGEVGPAWAQELNTAIGDVIDAHDHTSGNGVQVPVAGLNIDDNLEFNEKRIQNASGYHLAMADPAPTIGTAEGRLFRDGDELYFQDGAGNNVQLTQGGAIVPNGTGAANGFYGDYAASTAHASYYAGTASYQFYQDSGESIRAALVGGQIQSVQATQNDFYLGTGGGDSGGTATAVTGGWRFRATDSDFGLARAAAASSSYATVTYLSEITAGVAGDFAFSVNSTNTDYPLSATKRVTGASFHAMTGLRLNWTGGGVAPVGLGGSVRFYEANEAKTMGEVHAYYAAKTTSSNGASVVCLMPTFNGASPTTGGVPVGVSVGRFSSAAAPGSLAVGLMGPPVSGQGVTVYGDLVPDASGGLLGTVALPWAIRATNVIASGSVTTTNAVNAGGGVSATATSAFHSINPFASDTYLLGNSGNIWSSLWTKQTSYRNAGLTKTQITAYDGIVHHAISVSSGGSTVFEYTANNTCTVTKTGGPGTGTYDLDFSTSLPATQCLFFGSLADNGGYSIPAGVQVSQASTTKLQVSTFNGGASADLRFNIMILSTGF